MKKIMLMTAMLFLLSGCTGLVTGHEYKMSDAKVVYQVTKLGVTTFMTQEEIEANGLDTLNDATVKIYELSEGND
jgi:uncharacterized protein YceK